MNYIDSYGGPFIILSEESAPTWSAIDAKTFFPSELPGDNDYQVLDYIPEFQKRPPSNIAFLRGVNQDALIIAMPFDIAIIKSTISSTFIAQIHYAEPEWSFDNIKAQFFNEAVFSEHIRFQSRGGPYLVFDSACLSNQVKERCLRFSLTEGDYVFSAAFYKPDDITLLLLYKIELTSELN